MTHIINWTTAKRYLIPHKATGCLIDAKDANKQISVEIDDRPEVIVDPDVRLRPVSADLEDVRDGAVESTAQHGHGQATHVVGLQVCMAH